MEGVTQATNEQFGEGQMKSSHRDQMFELMSQGVWQVDAAGKTVFVNSRMAAMVGYSPEQFLPLPSLSLVGEADRGRIAARIASRRNGVRDDYECQIAHKDGSWVSVIVEAVPLYRDDGQFDGTLALVTNITDRQRLEDALRFTTLTRNLQLGVLIQGPDATILLCNPKALELLGLTEDQLQGRTSLDPTWNAIHEDGSPFPGPTHPVPEAIATRQAVRGVVMGVFRPTAQDRVWLLVDAIPELGPDRTVRQVVCTFTDITARKQAEDALRVSAERFRLSMEATNDGLWDWDIATDEGYFSPQYFRMLGYEVGNFGASGASWSALIHPDDRERVLQANLHCIEGRCDTFAVEYRMKAKNGAWRWILGRGKCVARDAQGRALRLLGTHSDVTDRKQAEEALRKSETLLKGLTDAVPDPLFMKDREGRCLFANPATLKLLGKSLDQVLGKTDREVHDDPRLANTLTENERRVMETGVAQEIEEVIRTPDGEHILHTAKAPLRDEDGRVIGIVGCARDVTERKRTEAALRESALALQQSESQTQMALAIGHAGSWHYNIQTEQIWGSAEGLRMFGYPPVAKYWPLEDIEVCIPERERVHQALVALLSEGRPYDLEYQIHPADGSPAKELHSIATVKSDPDGNPIEVVGFVQDITVRKRAEDELRRLAAELTEANRLKDVFTDVLRHDIVNPAGAIQTATDVLLMRESDAMTTEALLGIRQAAANLIAMTDLASKLATVAARDDIAFFADDPVQALRSVVMDLEHRLTAKNITLMDHSGAEFAANFNPIVKEVFANLISNAIKYSPSGTRIDVCAEDQGEFWDFFVKDQGVGVPDEHKQTIFHRFERLGRDGVKGTGLGLAITEQIVRLHRGRAWVEDNPSGGSIFFVRLPKAP